MKKVIALAALLAIGGCSELGTITGSSAPASAAYALANSANTAIAGGTVYLKLPLCSTTQTVACRTASGSSVIWNSIKTVQTLRNGLITILQQNGGGDIPIANYNNLQTAMGTLTAALTQYSPAQ